MINCNLEKNTQSKKETRMKETFMLHSKASSYGLTDVEQTDLLNKHMPTFEIYHILLFELRSTFYRRTCQIEVDIRLIYVPQDNADA